MAQAKFKFFSQATGGNDFIVVSFSGNEALSRLYRYEIEIKLPRSVAIDLDEVLDSPARFVTFLNGDEFPVHGVIASIDELQTVHGYVHFRAVLVPRLWWLTLYRTNEIYTDEPTIDQVIEQVLDNAASTLGVDLDFDISAIDTDNLLQREYRCQFGESDFDFLSRLAENEGIFYYFDHSGDAEKIVFQNKLDYQKISKPELIFDVSTQTQQLHDSINSWSCRKQRLPAEVTVRDYNPNHPSLDIHGTVAIDPLGRGSDYLYGENIADEEEAEYLGAIRAEERLCNRTRFYGESSVPRLRAGYTFNMDMHPNDSYNGMEYLTIEVNREGHSLDTQISSSGKKASAPQYRNNFVAMQADEQYRPPRTTPKPRFHGTMTAFIYAETGVNQAEIDEYGRYRVLLPFDRADGAKESDDPERKSSTWIRMAQNYVGEGKGSYYPLTGGTEVLLSFINGDPDQPIIVGAVPNASEPSLLTTANEFESTVQTGSGNKIRMGDIEGEDRIVMESPTANSWMRIGTPNDPFVVDADPSADGVKISSDGAYELVVGGNATETVSGDVSQTVSGNATQTVAGNSTQTITGDYLLQAKKGNTGTISFELNGNGVTLNTGGKALSINTGDADFSIDCGNYSTNNKSESDVTKWAADTETFYGNKFEWMLGGTEEFYVGGKLEACVAESVELYAGFKQEAALSWAHETHIGIQTELSLSGKFGFNFGCEFSENLINLVSEAVKAKKSGPTLEDRVVALEATKIKLYKGIFNLNKATAKLDNANLYMSL